jgi:ribosomal protein L35
MKVPRSPRIPPETQELILAAYKAGDDTSVIRERFGCTAAQICKLARRHGILRRPRKNKAKAWGQTYVTATDEKNIEKRSPHRPKPPPPKVFIGQAVAPSEIRRLRAKGLGRTAIASMLRCSYRDIDDALAGA